MLWRAVWSAATSAFRRRSARRVLKRARRAKVRGGASAAARALMHGVESLPHSPELWNALSVAQIEEEDFMAAERSARRALELDPVSAEAHNNHGVVQVQTGQEHLALASFERALELDPRFVAALRNRAGLLSQLQRVDAAIGAWDGVLRVDSGYAVAYAGKGALMVRAGRFQEARENLERALALGSRDPSVALHLALIEAAVGDSSIAERMIAALRGQFDDAEIDWELALIHLSQGFFATGWPLYEARLRKSFESPRRGYPFPEWQGERLGPGELLVMAEQGLGDEIMFASCYADALARAPRCVVECDPRLAGLLARSFPGASVVGQARGNDGRWLKDYPGLRKQIHAGSLPRLFRSGVERFPRHSGYLRPDPQRVEVCRRRLVEPGMRLKVGLAWNGGIAHTRRELRCVPLAELARLMRGTAHQYVSLQHDDDGTDARRLAELAGTPVRVISDVLANIDEMAAALCGLDVVITVCSSVAHLSGAVGVRTWVLTPAVAEWRYLKTGTGLPWYPSVRLFRQPQPGAWCPVIESVAAELLRLPGNAGEEAQVNPGRGSHS